MRPTLHIKPDSTIPTAKIAPNRIDKNPITRAKPNNPLPNPLDNTSILMTKEKGQVKPP